MSPPLHSASVSSLRPQPSCALQTYTPLVHPDGRNASSSPPSPSLEDADSRPQAYSAPPPPTRRSRENNRSTQPHRLPNPPSAPHPTHTQRSRTSSGPYP